MTQVEHLIDLTFTAGYCIEIELTCRGHDTLLRTRLDPIVSPGKVAGHVHLFMGSSGISQDMDDAKAKAGACTTNGMAGDHSGYVLPLRYT